MPIYTKEPIKKWDKKSIEKNDFYKFQIKHLKKDALIDLKWGFDEDLKKLHQFTWTK